MSNLREQVQGLIDKHDVDSYRASVGAEHSSYPSATVTTDRIMALIAEAMLNVTKPTTYAEEIAAMSPETGGWRRQAMERDLAAAGITPGDAREGGEGNE